MARNRTAPAPLTALALTDFCIDAFVSSGSFTDVFCAAAIWATEGSSSCHDIHLACGLWPQFLVNVLLEDQRSFSRKLQQSGLLKTRGFICFSVLSKNILFKKAEHDVGISKDDKNRELRQFDYASGHLRQIKTIKNRFKYPEEDPADHDFNHNKHDGQKTLLDHVPIKPPVNMRQFSGSLRQTRRFLFLWFRGCCPEGEVLPPPGITFAIMPFISFFFLRIAVPLANNELSPSNLYLYF